MKKKGKKRKRKPQSPPGAGRLNPLLTVDELAGESLYAIVDFSLPGTDSVRRIISKKCGDGSITAVSYIGIVGTDRTCYSKTNILEMRDASEQQFWMTVRLLEQLYLARGGTVEIRNYAGKTMREAAELMRRLGNAKVWTSSGPEHDL